MNKTWYNDPYAKELHNRMAEEMQTIIDKMCQGYELSHMGVNRNFDTEEIILKLHLNPKGKIKVIGDGLKSELGYSRIGRNNV